MGRYLRVTSMAVSSRQVSPAQGAGVAPEDRGMGTWMGGR